MGLLSIRDNDVYGGYRVMLNARYDTILVPLSVDISTGDVITPTPVTFTFFEIFNNKSFDLLAYNIETVMAEKIETILRRTVLIRDREIFMMFIFLQQHKNLIKGYFLKRCRLHHCIAVH